MNTKTLLITILSLALLGIGWSFLPEQAEDAKIISYEVDAQQLEVKMYWKNTEGKRYANFKQLKADLNREKQELVFAMNGGMYLKDRSPQGLYIEKGKTLKRINRVQEAYGNFYLQPNGIFYLTKDKKGYVCTTKTFETSSEITYATQSGPMLVIDGKIHPAFREGSSNVHIRNGVGILPNGNMIFAISTRTINLYDFASFFLQKGCQQALYLDGFVSRMYLPSQDWVQWDGNFGVMIGASKAMEP